MPRPQKWRKICTMPRCTGFTPENAVTGGKVKMTVDEYETIRLIDWEGLTQEQCAEQMEVGRTTVQAIYQNARKKLADCIVNGSALVIGGGEYRVCEHQNGCCDQGFRHRCARQKRHMDAIANLLDERKETKMKIAVTYEDGQVFQHFGHTEHFKIYEVSGGKVQSSSILETKGNGHGALADILKQNNIDTLICGGIGAGAKNALAEAGIQLRGGVVGDADQVIADLLANKLSFNPNAECSHHHGEDSHDCRGNCHGHSH